MKTHAWFCLEWEAEAGPLWMNKDNLQSCLPQGCYVKEARHNKSPQFDSGNQPEVGQAVWVFANEAIYESEYLGNGLMGDRINGRIVGIRMVHPSRCFKTMKDALELMLEAMNRKAGDEFNMIGAHPTHIYEKGLKQLLE